LPSKVRSILFFRSCNSGRQNVPKATDFSLQRTLRVKAIEDENGNIVPLRVADLAILEVPWTIPHDSADPDEEDVEADEFEDTAAGKA
jgi:hypothetical protein